MYPILIYLVVKSILQNKQYTKPEFSVNSEMKFKNIHVHKKYVKTQGFFQLYHFTLQSTDITFLNLILSCYRFT
jgi:hypothetical protein